MENEQENLQNTGELQESIRDEKGRIKPGYSLNPDGRPLGAKNFTTKIREALLKVGDGNQITYEEALIKKVMQLAIVEGDTAMIKLVWNYLDGMPPQTFKHEGGLTVVHLSLEERSKLNNILYGNQPTVPTVAAKSEQPKAVEGVKIENKDDESGSVKTGNQWKSRPT